MLFLIFSIHRLFLSLISSNPRFLSFSSRELFSSSLSSSEISASPNVTERGCSPNCFNSDSTTIMQRLQTIFFIYSFTLVTFRFYLFNGILYPSALQHHVAVVRISHLLGTRQPVTSCSVKSHWTILL